jgi:hypothetical protein
MKLTTKLPNGKLKVNKAVIIAKLRKACKARHDALALGVINVGQREATDVAADLTRNNIDNFINTNEE